MPQGKHWAFKPEGRLNLVPQLLIGLDPALLTVLNVHAPEAEAIHDFSQAVIVMEKLDRSHDVEENLCAFSHPQRMDRAWVFGDVVPSLGLPGISGKDL
jgi:hypothetical protein